jgi:hypothetical protein
LGSYAGTVEDVRLSTTAADNETTATPATAAPKLVTMGTLDEDEEALLDVADAEEEAPLLLLGPASATVANLDNDGTRRRQQERAEDDDCLAAAAAAAAAIGERSAAIRIMVGGWEV